MRGEDLSRLVVVDATGAGRELEAGDFPLALGGAASVVELPGTALAAHLGLDGGEVFVQPVAGGAPVACNGGLLTASRWLRDGDLLRVGDHRLRCSDGEEGLVLTVVAKAAPSPPPAPRLVPPPRPSAAAAAAGEAEAEPPARIRPLPYTPPRSSATRRMPTWLPWRSLSLLAFLVLLLAPAWYLFTARSVVVEVEPEVESLRLSGGWIRPRVFDAFLLLPGTYRAHATLEGYRPLDEDFTVGSDARQTIRLGLTELPGLLAVRSEPSTGAEIRIDDVAKGAEPVSGVEVEKGPRRVRLVAEGYVEHEETVTIEGRGAAQELVVELVPIWAPVTFRSRPAGARVLVDGAEVGTTPSTNRVLAGEHRLELKLAGHKTARRGFRVEPDTPLELPVMTLAVADAGLSVASQPSGAAVAVAGVFRGVTPLDVDLGAGAAHQVVVSLAGYETYTEAVELLPEEARELVVELEPRLGEIEVVARPAQSGLWVDGERVESEDGVLRLLAVPHEIEIKLNGYLPQRHTVTPRPGFRQRLDVTLETAEEVAERSIEPVLRTAQGQELRLIGSGKLTMGASRREPGRRANETIRQVEISRRFYVASHEVSNGQYREFNAEHRSGRAGNVPLERDDHPVVQVSWEDAARYCNWLSARDSLPAFYTRSGSTWVPVRPLNHGYRLPLESEWALVARYPDGKNALKYPWGDSMPVPEGAGNYADASAAGLLASALSGYRDGHAATAPVGSFSPNALGLFDLGGNVAEWVHDRYSLYAGASGVQRDPIGPDEGEFHVIRGASWMHDSVTELRLSYRDYGGGPRPDLGFRIARFLESTE